MKERMQVLSRGNEQRTFGSSPTSSWRKQQKLTMSSPPAQLMMHTPTSVKSTLHRDTPSVNLSGCPWPLNPSILSSVKRYSSLPHQMSILQYADDTCLTASSKANCQAMLNTTQKWLDWSLLKAKAPKCAAISIHGHTGRCTNPHLSISNERILFLGSKSTSFLGLPVNATLSTDSIKEQLQQKLEQYLNLTDQSHSHANKSSGFTRKPSAPICHGYLPS